LRSVEVLAESWLLSVLLGEASVGAVVSVTRTKLRSSRRRSASSVATSARGATSTTWWCMWRHRSN